MHQQQDHDDDNSSKHMKPGWSGGSQSSESSISKIFPPFKDQIKERSCWLIGLLFLQSMSSFIIQYNEQFLADNMVLVQFLTMLVGAGGNAGNQAAVRVIRCLALGTLNKRTMKFFLLQGKLQ
jgi:Mg/Co/Ni transporter MgtE